MNGILCLFAPLRETDLLCGGVEQKRCLTPSRQGHQRADYDEHYRLFLRSVIASLFQNFAKLLMRIMIREKFFSLLWVVSDVVTGEAYKVMFI